MEKKYQIFVSSTYKDLMEERSAITEAIIQKKHIPVAMEFFSASNLSQLQYIKKLLDYVDYYVLIVGGRYGSIDEETGKSFTHLEFEYAFDKKIPILFFYPKYPDKIPQNKLDVDSEKRRKLEDFIKIAMKDRLAYAYEDSKDLKSSFIISLDELISDFPRIGWVRAEEANNSFLIDELREVKEKNSQLIHQNEDLKKKVIKKPSEDVYNYDENIPIVCQIEILDYHGNIINDSSQIIHLKLSDFLHYIGYKLMNGFSKDTFNIYINEYLSDKAYDEIIDYKYKDEYYTCDFSISERDNYSILFHMEFLSLVEKNQDDSYKLTDVGKNIVGESILFKKPPF